MFVLHSDISIGEFVHVKPYDVKISKSISDPVDRAVIKLPISARLHTDGKFQLMTVTNETAKLFKEGDKVVIKLGYNGLLKTEFEGFVSRINFTKPLEIECEGYSYQLRRVQPVGTFYKIQLKDILKKIIKGTDIVLDDEITDFEIAKIALKKMDGMDALHLINSITGGHITFCFNGNSLYSGLKYNKIKPDVEYQFGWNVIKDNNLKKRQAAGNEVISVWIGHNNDGTTTRVQTGRKGIEKIKSTHAVTEKKSLQKMCDKDNSNHSYEGYEGKLTAFGQPYCEPGYRIILTDNVYKEREGHYLVDSTEVTYGTNGFRRLVGLSNKL